MEEEIPNRQDMIYFQVFYQVFGILLIKSEKIVSTLNTVAKTLAWWFSQAVVRETWCILGTSPQIQTFSNSTALSEAATEIEKSHANPS